MLFTKICFFNGRVNARNSTQHSIYFNITKKLSTSAASFPRIIETKGSVPIHLFTDDIEKQALDQLKTLAESNIATDFIAVMPDVHLGKGVTIGCVFASEKYICPNAVGVDIGCGLAAVPIEGLVKSDMRREQLTEIQKLIKERIPTGFNQHRHSVKGSKEILKLISSEIQPTPFLKKQLSLPRVANQLGTLGGGNHFLEVVYDSKTEEVWILLHSGSRNIGNRVAQHYDKVAKGYLVEQGIDVKKLKGIHYMPIDSKEGQNYLRDMEWCQKYAFHNRRIMKEIMVNIMFEVTGEKANEKKAINIHHNYCSCEICGNRRLYITRKGATSAKLNEMGIIPVRTVPPLFCCRYHNYNLIQFINLRNFVYHMLYVIPRVQWGQDPTLPAAREIQ